MLKRIILLSGPIGAGKSELAQRLHERHGAAIVKTSDLLKLQVGDARVDLQKAGAQLDRETGGGWVATSLSMYVDQHPEAEVIAIDSVRYDGQITAIRTAFGTRVHHIHLTAPEDALRDRYQKRAREGDQNAPFDEIRQHATEKGVADLANLADVVVDTHRCSADSVCVRATALLGFYPRSTTPLVDVLIGGQYGSEGKGNIVGHIAPEYSLLVRVGGPNAGHQVFGDPPDKFFHIPSGASRAPNAHLLLGAGSLIHVPKLMAEIQDHQISSDRLSIDPQAMIILDEDKEAEEALRKSISSTAQGVGAASARKIMGRATYEGRKFPLAKDVDELKPFIRDSQPILERAYLGGERILLEGTQGTSLSLHHSQYPWCTSRDTTVSGCLSDAGIAPGRVRRIVMVCRTFPIRVGGPSGPMDLPLEMKDIAERSGIDLAELEKTERTTTTNRERRIAEFDWVQLRRASLLNGPTDIAITFADYFSIANRKAFRFEQLTDETVQFVEEVERVTGVPVTMISTKFDWRNVIDRRAW